MKLYLVKYEITILSTGDTLADEIFIPAKTKPEATRVMEEMLSTAAGIISNQDGKRLIIPLKTNKWVIKSVTEDK